MVARWSATAILSMIKFLLLLVLVLPVCVAADCDQFRQTAYDAQLNHQTEQAQTYEPESRLGKAMMLDVSRVYKKPVWKTTDEFADRRARQFASDWYQACNWGVYNQNP